MSNSIEKAGYHLTDIPRGTFGDADKVLEEALEFVDAVSQGVTIMALIELSDLIGAVQGFLLRHHPNISLSDLISMSEVTQRAFRNGHRN